MLIYAIRLLLIRRLRHIFIRHYARYGITAITPLLASLNRYTPFISYAIAGITAEILFAVRC